MLQCRLTTKLNKPRWQSQWRSRCTDHYNCEFGRSTRLNCPFTPKKSNTKKSENSLSAWARYKALKGCSSTSSIASSFKTKNFLFVSNKFYGCCPSLGYRIITFYSKWPFSFCTFHKISRLSLKYLNYLKQYEQKVSSFSRDPQKIFDTLPYFFGETTSNLLCLYNFLAFFVQLVVPAWFLAECLFAIIQFLSLAISY